MLKVSKGSIRSLDGSKNGLNIILNENYCKFVELSPSQNALVNILGIDSVKCEIVEKPKKDTGEMYFCLEVSIDDYKTIVYLDKAEQYLISITRL